MTLFICDTWSSADFELFSPGSALDLKDIWELISKIIHENQDFDFTLDEESSFGEDIERGSFWPDFPTFQTEFPMKLSISRKTCNVYSLFIVSSFS